MDIDSLLHKYQISYYKLPSSAKKFLGSLYGKLPLEVRFGKHYSIHKKILHTFEDATEQYKLDFQYNKTLETLQFCYDYIPYYKNLFDAYDFKIENFKDLRDIKKLPYLTKEIIQKELQSLYTDKMDKVSVYHTGGSSGTPMKLYAPRSISRAKEKVYTNHTLKKIGYNYRDRAMTLSARGKANEQKKLYWEYQMVDCYLLVSVNHLDKQYIPKILDEIRTFKPKIIYGFPSAISLFVKSCRALGIDTVEHITGVVLSSESVLHEDLEAIKDFFKVPVISHYGHTERVVTGYRIDKGMYNFYNSYGLTRVVDSEIVGTSFDNIVMPYVNYKTKDYIVGTTEVFKDTDIMKSTENIQGRIQEFVVTKNKRVMPILSIGAGHFDSYSYVEQTQFYQDTPGKIIINIQTKHPEYIQKERMITQMQKQVDHAIDFEIKLVDRIQNTTRRKRILCVQKLNIEDYYRKNKSS